MATLDALDAALGSGLVAEETAERYRFPHDIVRRTLVAQLSGARRRALHARLAEAIESQRADRLHAYTAILAHHTSSAAGPWGDRRRSAGRAAAAQATERRAPVEAVRLERQALAHVPADDGSHRAEVLTDLAMALLAAGDPGGEPTLIEAAAVARRHGRFDLLARAALALAERTGERPSSGPMPVPSWRRPSSRSGPPTRTAAWSTRLQARRGARGVPRPALPTKPWMSCADALTRWAAPIGSTSGSPWPTTGRPRRRRRCGVGRRRGPRARHGSDPCRRRRDGPGVPQGHRGGRGQDRRSGRGRTSGGARGRQGRDDRPLRSTRWWRSRPQQARSLIDGPEAAAAWPGGTVRCWHGCWALGRL